MNALKDRRTVHKFLPEKVEDQLVKEAIETALYAPNHKNTQPWKFYWVGPQNRERIYQRALELNGDTPGQREKFKQKLLNPSHLLVVTQKVVADEFQALEDYATIACAFHNIALYLWGHGVGTKWSTGKISRDPQILEQLSVPIETERVRGFLWVGKAKEVPAPPERPQPEEVIVFTP